MAAGMMLLFSCAETPDDRSPIDVVQAIADKVILETTFDFERVPQETVLGVQFIDFRRLFGPGGPGVGYAYTTLESTGDTTITFGISGSDGIKIWINKDLVHHQDKSRAPELSEIAFWGRANGWVVWAVTETLTYLPEDHPAYTQVLDIFQRHMAGLAACQDQKSGMWHQVLDHPESYEETSCTSMFVLGMARGVSMGWLDEAYRERALKGWTALKRKVDADGTVHGICRGTGVGDDLRFYFERPTFDHDPRGLGSMIIATVHNIGNAVAGNVEVAFFVDDEEIGTQTIDLIEAPNDLHPRIVEVRQPWRAVKGSHRIAINAKLAEKEITVTNNRVERELQVH